MNFTKTNNIVGWIVGLIACSVYLLTMEPTASFWDCGEYISCCYKLEIPHPPGAPLFTLLGRFFTILFGDNPRTAAVAVNAMSALASGFTILFLFWTITHFARKIVVGNNTAVLTKPQLFQIMGAGAVGALAYTFTDSFWFSAVEGEVYAMSSLFTAFVFWAILKWEHEVDREAQTGQRFSRADRWLVLIFYVMGLSIGVHLLNLLTIPALVMVYYFKRYKVTRWGAIGAFLIGCVITGIIQVVIIQWSVKAAGAFDIFFVNEVGLPFFMGFGLYFLLIALLLVIGLRFNQSQIAKFRAFPVWLTAIILLLCFPVLKSGGAFAGLLLAIGVIIFLCYNARGKILAFFRVALWSTIFLIMGYSTYITTLIRSNANPPVDMYNVDNPVALIGYLGREQYGDWPVLYGPYFTENPTADNFVTTGNLYVRGQDKYEVAGELRKLNYGSMNTAHLFPRVWDAANERNQHWAYKTFGGLQGDEEPTTATDVKYFLNYQFRWMYWRYFMWNFVGRQNDLQGYGGPRDGNWQSGIEFIDRAFGISTPGELPDSIGKHNKASNKLYFLPLLLGIAGFIFHYRKSRNDFIVTLLLFFFTGLAIVLYLNQSGLQPRERDYAYVGSFYAFAIWIGLGLLWVNNQLSRFIKGAGAGYFSFLLCMLAVPVLMASQEWDDHDRSKKYLARAMATNYLESCDKNALLITEGDNDTYPLWYAQEVEAIRPDVRVMVHGLMATDWYMNQLRYKVNQSAPFDLILTKSQVEGSRREQVPLYPVAGYNENTYYDLYTTLKDITASEDTKNMVRLQNGEFLPVFPARKVVLPVSEEAKKQFTLYPGDSVVNELRFEIKTNNLYKNDLALLAIMATNNWKRPIYFGGLNIPRSLGLEQYCRQEGMLYRLVPIVSNGALKMEPTQQKLAAYKYGNANATGTGIYFDEINRFNLQQLREINAMQAILLSQHGKKEEAKKIVQQCDQLMPERNSPYGVTSAYRNNHNRISLSLLEAAYACDELAVARKITLSLKNDITQQMRYYRSLGNSSMSNEQLAMQAMQMMQGKAGDLSEKQLPFIGDIVSCMQQLGQMEAWEEENKNKPKQ